MAKKNKNTQNQNQNQYYTYDPMYGFIPADQNADANAEANMAGAYQQYPNNFGQGFGPGYGYGQGFRHNFGQGFGNPMQQNHVMHMNAMQEQINQLQAALNNGSQTVNNSVSQEKIQEIYSVMNDISQGKAGPEKLLPLMQNTSADFWKGLALGAGAILLFNCTPLKDMLGNLIGAGLGSFMGKADDDGFDDDGFDDDGFDDDGFDAEETSEDAKA